MELCGWGGIWEPTNQLLTSNLFAQCGEQEGLQPPICRQQHRQNRGIIVQKKGIIGVPWTQWCGSKGDLAVLWLDFTDAYESIPQYTTSLEDGEKKHPLLTGLCWRAHIWLAPAWNGDYHQVHHLWDPVHDKHAGQSSSTRMQRSIQPDWTDNYPKQPHSNNNSLTGPKWTLKVLWSSLILKRQVPL